MRMSTSLLILSQRIELSLSRPSPRVYLTLFSWIRIKFVTTKSMSFVHERIKYKLSDRIILVSRPRPREYSTRYLFYSVLENSSWSRPRPREYSTRYLFYFSRTELSLVTSKSTSVSKGYLLCSHK